MAKLDRENMAEDVRERFDELSDYEQRAIEAIMEARDCSIEEALDIVESGDYDFYPEFTSMADIAYELVHEYGLFGIPSDILAKIDPYIDYDKLGLDISVSDDSDYYDTSFGIVRIG